LNFSDTRKKFSNTQSFWKKNCWKVYYKILKKVNIFDEAFLSVESLEKSISLCKDIDEKDAIFVAVTLELDGVLWTGDLKLKEGLTEKGFTKFYTPTPFQ